MIARSALLIALVSAALTSEPAQAQYSNYGAPPRITPPVVVPRVPRITPDRVAPRDQPAREETRQSAPRQSTPVQQAAPRRPVAPKRAAAPRFRAPPPLPVAPPGSFSNPAILPAGTFDPAAHEPDAVLVRLAPGTDTGAVAAIAQENDLRVLSRQRIALLDREIVRLGITDGRTIEDVTDTLNRDPRVEGAHANTLYRPQGGSSAPGQYSATRLRLSEAHAIATGSRVKVAVIDTGIDASHPVLAGASVRTTSVVEGNPVPDDHGTQIAGLIAATTRLIGGAPAVDLIAIEAFARESADAGPETTAFRVVSALDRAQSEGARVINMSFAGGEDPLVSDMLDALDTRGIVLVAAAGNGGPDAAPAYPGAHPATLAVTATDARDGLYEGANNGAYVTLAAPGVDVLTAANGGRYALATGTSMAAAYVSAAAALLLERDETLTPQGMRARLAAHAHDLGEKGHDPLYGAGLIDPLAALSALAAPPALAGEAGAGLQ